MNKTLTAIVVASFLAAGVVGYGLGRSSVVSDNLVSELSYVETQEAFRNKNFRERVIGTFYPEMWDGDAIGNYWIDESKAPARILDGDAIGNYWVSDDKIIEDLRNIYQRVQKCP